MAFGRMPVPPVESAFVVFDAQDSGCLSYGVEEAGRRWLVKTATTVEGRASLDRAVAVHAAVSHPAIVRPTWTIHGTAGPTLVYPWYDGTVLNHATAHGTDRSALTRFQRLPVPQVEVALDAILDAHLAVSAAGLVAVDLYDGCFLYNFAANRMRLIDLDEYRRGPFVLAADRLPGSRRYMAPEEFTRGAIIDERTTVHNLGRALHHLLDSPADLRCAQDDRRSSPQAWRGSSDQRRVVERATRQPPDARYPGVSALVRAWRLATPVEGGAFVI
ncbi:serine/threonine protein kinase [Micromonospora sp. NPDC053740]|uniref:serine/threonine protein kinase n=1 Tax=Micromonospora sp. NPDC053740 TaxID=3155173 RepID=UPI00341B047D